MSEFKVGDKIRRITNEGSKYPMEIGSIHEVIEARRDGAIIKLAGDTCEYWREAGYFERAFIESAKDMEALYE